MHHLGFVSTLDDKDMHHLHRADLVITRDAQAPPKWGRAPVISASASAGIKRLGGVAVLWGPDADAIAKALLQGVPPDPIVLVASAVAIPDGHALHAAAERVRRDGRRWEVIPLPKTGGLCQLYIDGADVRGLPTGGAVRTRPPAPRPAIPHAVVGRPPVVRSDVPDTGGPTPEPTSEPEVGRPARRRPSRAKPAP